MQSRGRAGVRLWPSAHWRQGVVPGSDGRGGSFVAEDRDARGIQREMRTSSGRKVAPSRAEDPEHVSVPEHGHVALGLAEPSNHSVCPSARLVDRLAPDERGGPHGPAWLVSLDVGSGPTLVYAIVELAQIIGHLGTAETGQLTCPAGPLQRAGQDEGEGPIGQHGAEALGLLLADIRQRQIGAPGVPSVTAPLRLAVAHENDLLAGAHMVSLPARAPGGGPLGSVAL